MDVLLNGEHQSLPDSLSLAALVDQLQLAPSRIAIELNRVVVRRAQWETTLIGEGDKIEIVHFVGGGAGDRFTAETQRAQRLE